MGELRKTDLRTVSAAMIGSLCRVNGPNSHKFGKRKAVKTEGG